MRLKSLLVFALMLSLLSPALSAYASSDTSIPFLEVTTNVPQEKIKKEKVLPNVSVAIDMNQREGTCTATGCALPEEIFHKVYSITLPDSTKMNISYENSCIGFGCQVWPDNGVTMQSLHFTHSLLKGFSFGTHMELEMPLFNVTFYPAAKNQYYIVDNSFHEGGPAIWYFDGKTMADLNAQLNKVIKKKYPKLGCLSYDATFSKSYIQIKENQWAMYCADENGNLDDYTITFNRKTMKIVEAVFPNKK